MFSSWKKRWGWQPTEGQFLTPLHTDNAFTLDLGSFRKGIDNAHIDVFLSIEFRKRTRSLIRNQLTYSLAENLWGEKPPPPSASDVQAMKESYAAMMEVAVAAASQKDAPELIQLLQLAVIKYFQQQIDLELQRVRDKLRDAKVQERHDSTGKSVEAHDRLVILGKNEPDIRYKISRKLFREMLWVERSRATKLRKSVLGSSWQIPKQLLFNPLLQLPSLWADNQLMNHYPLACTAQDNQDVFARINRLLINLFCEYLPGWCQPLEVHEKPTLGESFERDTSSFFNEELVHGDTLRFNQIRRVLEDVLQPEEYQQSLVSWLDSPQNIDRIIYSIRPTTSLNFEGSENIFTSSWVDKRWKGYYNRLLKRIYSAFKASGLVPSILASQMAPALYHELHEQIPVRLLCQFLSGNLKRKDLQRRLGGLPTAIPHQHLMKQLDLALNQFKRMPESRRRKHLLAFLHQFAQYRRDLKLAYRTLLALNRIRILERSEEYTLSRNNGTLHEFALHGELQKKQHEIRNHVILKADVRGSTEMTSQLQKRQLNPATHFSLNFFDPINDLLPVYGAKKVFVEGDAVILSIFEYEDTPFQWLCVAHACGLARSILKVVDAQNLKNRRYNLPDLELGLGIAFSDRSPTFLYDDNREIMISPAINRADQLSSCSATIKRSSFTEKRGRGIEVFSKSADTYVDKEASDNLMRYNVNGIELDVPAFYKLQSEMNLRKISTRGAPYAADGSIFYAGRYPDMAGRMHWLVVREGIVKQWQMGEVEDDEPARRFYEVVTADEVIGDIRRRAAGRKSHLLIDEPVSELAIKPFYLN